jgi:hopanoid biosynthesis associated RND transporter like protein HpnN
MLSRLVAAIVRTCTASAWPVVIGAILLGIFAGGYAVKNFQIDTNSDNLVSPNADWRQHEIHYDNAFPQQNNTIDMVIDGVTAERADEAAGALAAALSTNRNQFLSVRRPDGGPFFTREGLLLMPLPELKRTLDTLVKAQPFLGGLSADPSLRGVIKTLDTSLLGVTGGQTTLASLDKPITAFSATLVEVLAGKPTLFGWSGLLAGNGNLSRTRRFVEVQPKLDFSALRPGQKATRTSRVTAKRLGLKPENGARVRITGPVPMADDEFASITDRGKLLAGLMAGATLLMLWLALRSVRMILAILATIVIGLAITAAIGLLVYTKFNVISVAFIVLFVGLGVDFGIQFCVRYRAERHRLGDLGEALMCTGASAGPGLTLAAVAAALAFYSFLPTKYAGLAQLGGVAGTGMIVTYILSITLLPALLRLLQPTEEAEEIGFSQLRPVDRFINENCRRVLIGAIIVAFLAACAIPFMHFDSNPLDLRNPRSESVATALDLMKNPETSPNTINVLRPSLKDARTTADQLSKLPQVSQALTIESFVPEDQDAKLGLVRDAANLLDTVFDPLFVAPPPNDAEVIAALNETAGSLRNAAKITNGAAADHARALASTLERLAHASPDARARATHAFIPGLKTLLRQLKTVLHPAPIRFATLPQDLRQDWVTSQGEYRVQVFPVGSPNNRQLRTFTRAVLAAAPDATGTPVIILESAHTIVWAFVEAGIISFVSIVLILFAVLRRFGDEMMTLVPLVLAGVLTTATAVVFGIQFNFANIIALPLLFGVGVAFDIYFIMWWREGRRNLLESPLTRAVLMSAGTTGAAFGTLSLSSHPGTASMGVLLMISLFWILVTMLVVLPALLHRLLPDEGLEQQPAATPAE